MILGSRFSETLHFLHLMCSFHSERGVYSQTIYITYIFVLTSVISTVFTPEPSCSSTFQFGKSLRPLDILFQKWIRTCTFAICLENFPCRVWVAPAVLSHSVYDIERCENMTHEAKVWVPCTWKVLHEFCFVNEWHFISLGCMVKEESKRGLTWLHYSLTAPESFGQWWCHCQLLRLRKKKKNNKRRCPMWTSIPLPNIPNEIHILEFWSRNNG